ncbi:MAG: hypothetical protein ACFE96_06390 [Candidatus Hermodarchaeota archaeon]
MDSQKTQKYDKLIKHIETHLKVFTHESCIIIYTHLMIFGRMRYDDLLEKTRLGRATIFRSLKILQDAGLVKKGIDPDIEDKRKNTFYYAQEENIDLGRPDKEFMAYLKKVGKFDLCEKWLKNSISIPMGMIKSASNIIIRQDMQKSIDKTPTGRKRVILYGIDSYEDSSEILAKIAELIEELKRQRHERPDYKQPLEKPAIFSLIFFQLNEIEEERC